MWHWWCQKHRSQDGIFFHEERGHSFFMRRKHLRHSRRCLLHGLSSRHKHKFEGIFFTGQTVFMGRKHLWHPWLQPISSQFDRKLQNLYAPLVFNNPVGMIWLPYAKESKPFRYNTWTWQTDWQTDRQTELLYQYRVSALEKTDER